MARSGKGDVISHGLVLNHLSLLLLLDLEQQRTIDMWQHTTKGNGGANQSIKLLVAANSKLQVTRGDALDLEVLGSILRIQVSAESKCESQKVSVGQLTPASSRTSAVRYSNIADV